MIHLLTILLALSQLPAWVNGAPVPTTDSDAVQHIGNKARSPADYEETDSIRAREILNSLAALVSDGPVVTRNVEEPGEGRGGYNGPVVTRDVEEPGEGRGGYNGPVVTRDVEEPGEGRGGYNGPVVTRDVEEPGEGRGGYNGPIVTKRTPLTDTPGTPDCGRGGYNGVSFAEHGLLC